MDSPLKTPKLSGRRVLEAEIPVGEFGSSNLLLGILGVQVPVGEIWELKFQ